MRVRDGFILGNIVYTSLRKNGKTFAQIRYADLFAVLYQESKIDEYLQKNNTHY